MSVTERAGLWQVAYAQVRKAASLLRIVETISSVWRWVLLEPVVDGARLVFRKWEDIAEAAARVDDCLARFFRLCLRRQRFHYVRARNDLGGAHTGDIGAGSGEAGVELAVCAIGVCAVARRECLSNAFSSITSNTVVAG